jgi:hypothetical protein
LLGDEIERDAATDTSGLAIAAFAFSLFWLLGIGSILGIVLGVIARRRIAANPHVRGAGIALAAIIIGSATLMLLGASLLFQLVY